MNRLLLSTCLLIAVCFTIAGPPGLVTAQGTGPLTPVNHRGGEANVVVNGSPAYVGFGPRLAVLDVSDPAAPVRAASYPLPLSEWR